MGRFKATRELNRNPVKWLYTAALAGVLLASLFFWQTHRKAPTQLAWSNAANSLRSQSSLEGIFGSHDASIAPGRRLFPYSVIPGGVESALELRNAISHDPVISGHYKEFNLAKLRIIRLDQDRMSYASYRMDGRIYWTKQKLKLFKGETLITDGEHQARTRCGNRLSETPYAPVSSQEPAAQAMEALPTPELTTIDDVPLEISLGPLLGLLPPGSPVAASESSSPGIAIPPVVFPIAGGSGPSPVSDSPPTGSGEPLPIATPEPGIVLLLAIGLSIVSLVSIRK